MLGLDATDFIWQAPLTADGFTWGKCRPVERNASNEPEDMLVLAKSDLQYRDYAPLNEETGLFRTFADLQTDPDSILAFANQYGRLGKGAEVEVIPGEIAEPFARWKSLILNLRYLVWLWENARKGDETELGRYIRWNGKRAVQYSMPNELVRAHPALSDPVILSEETSPGTIDELGLKRGDLVRPALAYLARRINGLFTDLVNARLYWDKVTGRAKFRVKPVSLFGALVLQFANAIDGDTRHAQCPTCRRWFKLSPGINRANRVTCTDSCRTRAYRERQERARRLHAEGWSPAKISREIGSDLSTVRRWITNKREG